MKNLLKPVGDELRDLKEDFIRAAKIEFHREMEAMHKARADEQEAEREQAKKD